MKTVFFRVIMGSIGQESHHMMVFFYYLDYLKNNKIDPVLVFSAKPHNYTLNYLFKNKLKDIGIKFIDVSSNKLLSGYYNRVKRILKFDCNGMDLCQQVGSTKRYLDYVIHFGCKYAEAKGTYFDFEPFNVPAPVLRFSEEENKKGMEELKKMGINKKFVCVHARDHVFYPERKGDSHRNIGFESFYPSCQYLSKTGMVALRMGAKAVSVDKKLFNKDIIDYAGSHRTDFMDIWTIANCKFFLGSDAGLFNVSYLFNKPNAIASLPAFLRGAPWSRCDIFLPQKIWSRQKKRFLTYKEISQYDIGLDCWSDDRYYKEGFECVKSTPEEILNLTIEMDEVLDGKYQYTEEDNYLQQKFKSIFKVYHSIYHTPARVGREFLKQNKELFL